LSFEQVAIVDVEVVGLGGRSGLLLMQVPEAVSALESAESAAVSVRRDVVVGDVAVGLSFVVGKVHRGTNPDLDSSNSGNNVRKLV
jgi:hypothetical protein